MNEELKTLLIGLNKSIENIEEAIEFKNSKERIIEELEVMRGLVEVIDNNNSSIVPLSVSNKVDSYNLGAMVVNMANSGFTHMDIAEECSKECGVDFNIREVSDWLNNYVSLSSSKKSKVLRGSVFDSRNRLEELSLLLYSLLDTINEKDDSLFKYNKITKEEVYLQVIKEIRQLTKQATDLIEKIDDRSRIQEFQNTVIECLQREAPLVASKVIKSLREQQTIQQLAGLK